VQAVLPAMHCIWYYDLLQRVRRRETRVRVSSPVIISVNGSHAGNEAIAAPGNRFDVSRTDAFIAQGATQREDGSE
jgi:TolB-like protein